MFYIIVIFAAILAMPAKADETLIVHYAAHLTAPANVQTIGDADGHAMGLGHVSGLLISADGSVGGTIDFTVANDYVRGAGPWTAYVALTFNDGSVIWYKATGSTKVDGARQVFTGPITVLNGKGRFENAKGDGTVSGARIGSPETGADQYGEIVINIKK
jgi:hypothetical protein